MGRRSTSILWINDLSGSINQYAAPGLIANNQFEMLLNVSQSTLGAVSHRLGTELWLDRVASSNPVRGMQMYEKNDGTYYMHMGHDGNIYVSDEPNTQWDLQVAQANAGISSTSSVEFTNFINRHYYIGSGSSEYLRYITESGGSTLQPAVTGTADATSTGSTLVATTGIFNRGMVGMTVTNTTDNQTRTITAFTSSTTVTVNSAINNDWDNDALAIYVDGKYLATNNAYMMIAGSDVYPLRAYWTSLEGDTSNGRPFVDFSADYAITSAPHTGVAAFGNGRPFIIFTENSYMTVDPNTGQTDEQKSPKFGCVSHRSIGNVEGTLIWLSRQGFNMMAYNQAYPVDVSLLIENDSTGDAIVNQINGANFEVTAAGVIGHKYRCALRNLSNPVKGQTLNDCIVEYDASQQNWRVLTFPQGGLATVLAPFIDANGNYNLYAGSIDDAAVYKMDVADVYTDENGAGTTAAVTSVVRTKHYRFGSAESIMMKNIEKLHFEYYSAGAITVKYSLNGSNTYTTMPATLPATVSGQSWDWEVMAFGKECKSISLQLECSSNFAIYGIGFEVTSIGNEGISPV